MLNLLLYSFFCLRVCLHLKQLSPEVDIITANQISSSEERSDKQKKLYINKLSILCVQQYTHLNQSIYFRFNFLLLGAEASAGVIAVMLWKSQRRTN